MYTEGSLQHTHFSTTDSECVSLLPSVCEVLADPGRSLPDDTSLEKLLDWFIGLNKAGGSLLEACPCLLDFISTVVHNTAADPGVLSFTLRLTGLLAASDAGFRALQECCVLDRVFSLQRWQDAGLWEDPCLRIGWIQGLKNLLQHQEALSFLIKSDFIDPLLRLQTDTSLFVASAANQMLAQVLLFFQPASAECNGADKRDDGRAQTSIHSDVVMAILEHLRESLVPNERTQIHQSLQTLKLLALLLAQAGPPLRDTLLRTVADSLQKVVAAGCSQLTLPLMDVILAAHSSIPDQRVSRLLSSMLTTDRPSELLRAAAAFVYRGHHDGVHTAQAVRILLLPLHILTGQTLLEAAEDDHQISMIEQLKSKTSCSSAICVSLTNMPQVVLKPPAVLPCAPDSVVAAVLSLLRICGGVSSSPACGEVCRNVIGSGKVQKCALETLTALCSTPGAKEKICDVLSVLILYLDNPDCDPTVLHKSYQALVKWATVCADPSFITDQLRQDLAAVVSKRVCDMRWEVRDSTVEFLGRLAGECVFPKEDCYVSEALLDGCRTTSLLREALQDTESYVRASAISAMARTMAQSWQQGAAPSEEETEIVKQLLGILSQDTEGFPRRAVVRYFIAWFSSRPSHPSSTSLLMQCVRAVLSQGSADLDWEVKVHTLELAEQLLDQAFKSHWSCPQHTLRHPYGVVSKQLYTLHAHTGSRSEGLEPDLVAALNNVVEQGVISVLLSGLVDCDRPVGLKACGLLITLREAVCPLSRGWPDAAGVSCELPDWGWGLEIRQLLDTMRCTGAEEADIATQGALGGGDASEECGDTETVDVCEVLKSLGLDEKLDILTQSSDHIHNSPLSLLQDILTASSADTRPDTKPGQEVIVDCY